MSFKLGSDPKAVWGVIHIQYSHHNYCSRHFFFRWISHSVITMLNCANIFPFWILQCIFYLQTLSLYLCSSCSCMPVLHGLFSQLLQSISLHQQSLARCPNSPQRKHGPYAFVLPVSNLCTLPVACRAWASFEAISIVTLMFVAL